MKKTISLLFLSVLLISFSSYAQRWKRTRYEVVFGLGASNYLGELGGADRTGTNFIKDLELSMTRLALNFGIRYKLTGAVSIKSTLFYARIKGDDKLTNEPSRSNRNLSFRSPIAELSVQIEPSIIKERMGHRYRFKGIKGKKGFFLNTYPFIGIAVFYFNPKAKINGTWHALQPLSTEGQGIFDTRKEYSRIQISIPYGIGFKYGYKRNWSFGLELKIRKTFTDYLDDVSTTYVSNQYLYEEKGPIAATAADRSDGSNPNKTAAGQQRGDIKDKDSYMSAIFSLNYKFRWKKRRRSRPKF